jgi:hypothetical protein
MQPLIRINPMITMLTPFVRPCDEPRTHADLKPETINPLLSQSTAVAPASSTKPT